VEHRHVHDQAQEHDHDHVELPPDADQDFLEIEGFEQYALISVGIDIGSSTSQVVAVDGVRGRRA
jgi:hypothetical protein